MLTQGRVHHETRCWDICPTDGECIEDSQVIRQEKACFPVPASKGRRCVRDDTPCASQGSMRDFIPALWKLIYSLPRYSRLSVQQAEATPYPDNSQHYILMSQNWMFKKKSDLQCFISGACSQAVKHLQASRK